MPALKTMVNGEFTFAVKTKDFVWMTPLSEKVMFAATPVGKFIWGLK